MQQSALGSRLGFSIILVGLVLVACVGSGQGIPSPTGNVPVDWVQRVRLGFMLYNQTEPTREDIRPQIGNGYLSTTIGDDSVYISGVFNPLLPNQPASRSRRSRFPTPVNVTVEGATPFATALDVRRGIFYRRSYFKIDSREAGVRDNAVACMVIFEQRWFAHRVNRSLLIHELEVDTSRCPSSPTYIQITLINDNGGQSKDLNLTQINHDNSNPAVVAGSTILPEKPGGALIGVSYATTFVRKVLSVPTATPSKTFYHITAYLTSLDFGPYPLPTAKYAFLMEDTHILMPHPYDGLSNRNHKDALGTSSCHDEAYALRIDCGSAYLQQDTCIQFGCCYDAITQVGPRCYFGYNLTRMVYDAYVMAYEHRESLLKTHIAEWENLWQASIEVEGDTTLRNIVYASYYAILSSIRKDWPFSVSPGGLNTGGGNATGYPEQEREGYFGHTFWDADTWVMPSLLPLYPDLAQSIIEYRFNRIPASRIVAALYGYKGTKFAWESALTGLEECGFPNDEDHLSADIAIAVRQYFRATGDREWLQKVGFPLLQGIADFWVSRAEKDASGQYVIEFVQPPNEYADHVNNSVFTNAAASLALEFTAWAAHFLGVKVPDIYMEVSKKLKIPFDPTVQQYIEYDGRLPTDMTPIKQADVTLMGYPLQWPMSSTVKRNDLIHETEVMDPYGPAMTHGIFCIAWLDLGTKDADTLQNASLAFQNGYGLYVKEPYNVWIECPDPGCINQAIFNGRYAPPCPNFITGAGGFLQSLLYGYVGLRYNQDNVTIDPVLPVNTTSLKVNQLVYRTNKLDIAFDSSTVTFVPSLLNTPLFVVPADSERRYPLIQGQPLTLPVGFLTIVAQ